MIRKLFTVKAFSGLTYQVKELQNASFCHLKNGKMYDYEAKFFNFNLAR